MSVESTTYKIAVCKESDSIKIEGAIRLWDPQEYSVIKQHLLDLVSENFDKYLNLNMSNLEYLNSSGVSMICKFIFDLKRMNIDGMNIIGNGKMMWQKKSFSNFAKLWDRITVNFIDG